MSDLTSNEYKNNMFRLYNNYFYIYIIFLFLFLVEKGMEPMISSLRDKHDCALKNQPLFNNGWFFRFH